MRIEGPASRLAVILGLVAALAAAGVPRLHAETAAGPAVAEAPKDGAEKPGIRRRETMLDGRRLAYTIEAGPLEATGHDGAKADIFSTSYVAEGAGRPVTFVFNGGPGASSAYLHFGGLGPRLMAFGNSGVAPSDAHSLVDNPATWLGFTDLVFVDPVGTGLSRAKDQNDVAAKFYGVSVDAEVLADFVVRWLDRNGRRAAPLFLVGESYGGFRVVKLARRLEEEVGLGVRGLVLISPAMDFGMVPSTTESVLTSAALLPSLAAANREIAGPISRADLAEVEGYALGDYVVDLLKGQGNAEAVDRLSRRVAELTGLDEKLVRDRAGRVDDDVFIAERRRADGLMASRYDPAVTLPAPRRGARYYSYDPVLDGASVPLAAAAAQFFEGELGLKPDGRYEVLNRRIAGTWDWGRSRGAPEAASDLAEALAADIHLKVRFAHGLSDLVTPYLATRMLIDQLPSNGISQRVGLDVYPGGHMFYTRADSRRGFTEDMRRFYGEAAGG